MPQALKLAVGLGLKPLKLVYALQAVSGGCWARCGGGEALLCSHETLASCWLTREWASLPRLLNAPP